MSNETLSAPRAAEPTTVEQPQLAAAEQTGRRRVRDFRLEEFYALAMGIGEPDEVVPAEVGHRRFTNLLAIAYEGYQRLPSFKQYIKELNEKSKQNNDIEINVAILSSLQPGQVLTDAQKMPGAALVIAAQDYAKKRLTYGISHMLMDQGFKGWLCERGLEPTADEPEHKLHDRLRASRGEYQEYQEARNLARLERDDALWDFVEGSLGEQQFTQFEREYNKLSRSEKLECLYAFDAQHRRELAEQAEQIALQEELAAAAAQREVERIAQAERARAQLAEARARAEQHHVLEAIQKITYENPQFAAYISDLEARHKLDRLHDEALQNKQQGLEQDKAFLALLGKLRQEFEADQLALQAQVAREVERAANTTRARVTQTSTTTTTGTCSSPHHEQPGACQSEAAPARTEATEAEVRASIRNGWRAVTFICAKIIMEHARPLGSTELRPVREIKHTIEKLYPTVITHPRMKDSLKEYSKDRLQFAKNLQEIVDDIELRTLLEHYAGSEYARNFISEHNITLTSQATKGRTQ